MNKCDNLARKFRIDFGQKMCDQLDRQLRDQLDRQLRGRLFGQFYWQFDVQLREQLRK